MPTATELADALGIDVERVLDARLAAQLAAPDSLDRVDARRRRGLRDAARARRGRGRALGRGRRRPVARAAHEPPGPRDREILRLLRFEEDLTQSDIAARVGLSQMHVSRLLRNALDELASAAERAYRPKPD